MRQVFVLLFLVNLSCPSFVRADEHKPPSVPLEWQGLLVLEVPTEQGKAPRLAAVPSCSGNVTPEGLKKAEHLKVLKDESHFERWIFSPPKMKYGRRRKSVRTGVVIKTRQITIMRLNQKWMVMAVEEIRLPKGETEVVTTNFTLERLTLEGHYDIFFDANGVVGRLYSYTMARGFDAYGFPYECFGP